MRGVWNMNGIRLCRMSVRLLVLGRLLTILFTGCGQSAPPATPLDAAAVKKMQEASADDLGVPVEITNSISMRLALIPAGEFVMGTSKEEFHRFMQLYPYENRKFYESECPSHRVRISKPFYLGVHEVTVGEFRVFMNATDYKTEAEEYDGPVWNDVNGDWEVPDQRYTWDVAEFSQKDDQPVVNVTWNDAKAFCEWLCETEGERYRLPTEAEWEYACRAGTTTPFHFGSQLNGTEANCYGDWPYGTETKGPNLERTSTVGSYQPNAFGLYDMHGNVDEWCQDWYAEDYYANSPVDDPQGPSQGSESQGSVRVFRGGSWKSIARCCRSAMRLSCTPSSWGDGMGIRMALAPPDQ